MLPSPLGQHSISHPLESVRTVYVHMHFVNNRLFQAMKVAGRGCRNLWKLNIFREHPVPNVCLGQKQENKRVFTERESEREREEKGRRINMHSDLSRLRLLWSAFLDAGLPSQATSSVAKIHSNFPCSFHFTYFISFYGKCNFHMNPYVSVCRLVGWLIHWSVVLA